MSPASAHRTKYALRSSKVVCSKKARNVRARMRWCSQIRFQSGRITSMPAMSVVWYSMGSAVTVMSPPSPPSPDVPACRAQFRQDSGRFQGS